MSFVGVLLVLLTSGCKFKCSITNGMCQRDLSLLPSFLPAVELLFHHKRNDRWVKFVVQGVVTVQGFMFPMVSPWISHNMGDGTPANSRSRKVTLIYPCPSLKQVLNLIPKELLHTRQTVLEDTDMPGGI